MAYFPTVWKVEDDETYPGLRHLRGPSFKVSAWMHATDLTFMDGIKREAELQLMALAPDLAVVLRALFEHGGTVLHNGQVILNLGSSDVEAQLKINYARELLQHLASIGSMPPPAH